MSKKHTTEDILQLLDSKNLVWVDKVYINNKTPLNCVCKICGNTCNPIYVNLYRQPGGCVNCAGQSRPTNEHIKKILDEKNLIWIDEVYINSKTELNCVCKICNSTSRPTYDNLRKQGGCRKCGNVIGTSKLKIKIEEIEKLLAKYNLIWIDKEYINSGAKIKCKCKKVQQ